MNYFIRIGPGFGLGIIFLYLSPKKEIVLRIFGYILLFTLMRDAMTDPGFWVIRSEPTFWIRFHYPHVLIVLGILSALSVFTIGFFEPDLKALVKWKMKPWPAVLFVGVASALIIALPGFIYGRFIPLEMRGGNVAGTDLFWFLPFSLLGNFLEEALFRGYLQGYFEQTNTPLRAAVISGVTFSFCTIFLSATVTNVGITILVFTLYEGLICAFVRQRCGVISSTIGHGLGIFLLASSLI